MTFSIYTTSKASNYAGAAIGSFLLVPFVHKYSRRPLFLLSLAIQTGMTIWSASMTTSKELLPVCFMMGVGGSVSEKIVQNTTTDLLFVHQRVHTMVEAQGGRCMWWWATIVIGTFLLSTIGAFKETKYIPVLEGQGPTEAASPMEKILIRIDTASPEPVLEIDHHRRLKPYRERLALITSTPGKGTHHFYQPILVVFQPLPWHTPQSHTALSYPGSQ